MGGVERMLVNLVREFAAMPRLDVDLLVIRENNAQLADIPKNVNILRLGVNHTVLAIPAIAGYLKQKRPQAMLAAKDRAGRAAIRARRLAGTNTRICVRLGTNLSTALKHRSPFIRWLRTAPMRRIYRKIDTIIAVSEGVRRDTLAITRIPPERAIVIRNPVVTPGMKSQANEPPPHPWLKNKKEPVIMGMGRLSKQKGFPTLLHAFARIHKAIPSRLIIVGEGADRAELEMLARKLGITDRVALPGFQPNPYKWLAGADLFVLSSLWEGSPNVLTEALALGIPCVATHCPSGPDEILQDGRFGPLVPVGNAEALAEAMAHTMSAPLPAGQLRSAVAEYHSDISARHYLKAMQSQ
jgi:glycosyltransferase involved in cell wall biosynthesis